MTNEEFKKLQEKLRLDNGEMAKFLNVSLRCIEYWRSGSRQINPILDSPAFKKILEDA